MYQFQISPATALETWHHTVKNASHIFLRRSYYQFSLIDCSLKVGTMYLFNLRVKGLKRTVSVMRNEWNVKLQDVICNILEKNSHCRIQLSSRMKNNHGLIKCLWNKYLPNTLFINITSGQVSSCFVFMIITTCNTNYCTGAASKNANEGYNLTLSPLRRINFTFPLQPHQECYITQ